MTTSRTAVGAATGLLVLALATLAAGQPAGCSTPVSERQSEIGCYTTAETPLGVLPPGPLFWHLYAYPSRAAAEAARGPRGTVTDSSGKHWLHTIEVEGFHPSAGERIAVIGPLVIASGTPHTARFMEAVFPPGAQRGLNARAAGAGRAA